MPAAGSGVEPRLLSLDVLRGLVMLVLIPDVHGGFSFYEMARLHPDSAVWSILARLFTHAQWSGCTLWDLIMPFFVFMIGVSMPYSFAARKRRGDSDIRIWTHAGLRALTLLLLGVELLTPVKTLTDFLWPFALLALGLPVPRWVFAKFTVRSGTAKLFVEILWWGTVLTASAIRIYFNLDRIGLVLHDILPQVGLGFVLAFAVVNRSRTKQTAIALTILVLYWAAFAVYPLPPSHADLAAVGIGPTDQVFTGFFAHWNKGTNIAAAFDGWFLNLFPRSEPYSFTPHGYQTLTFIPIVVTMIFGVMAGEHLRSRREPDQRRNGLLGAGALAILAGIGMGWTLCPIVKSIWTPSWTFFSAGWALLVLGILYHLVDIRGRRRWVAPFVIAGMNSLLLYTLALHYQWWIVEMWKRILGATIFDGYFGPLLAALAGLLSLWLIAFGFHRMKIYVRI